MSQFGKLRHHLLKDSPPATRRQNIRLGVFWAACIALAGTIIGYNKWAMDGIEKQFLAGDIAVADRDSAWTSTRIANMPKFQLRDVSVMLGNCSPQYFWGHLVYYRVDDTVLPREHFVHVGRACRDGANGRWVLVEDVPYGWYRYWQPP